MSDDVRRGLPSASSFGADVACPGRRNLIATLEKVEDTSDPDAIRGIKIHRAWQTDNTLELNEDEMTDFSSGVKHFGELIQQWKEDKAIVKFEELEREERLWLHDHNYNCIGSGQLDRWYHGWDADGAEYVLVIDGKSGFGTYVPASQRSWQLRYYAVITGKELDCMRVRVAYVKPKMKAEPTDYTDYDEYHLTQSYVSIVHHTWETTLPEAHRNPGIHCRYCPAMKAAKCPEAAAWNMLPSVIAAENVSAVIPDEISKEEAAAMVSSLALPDCVKVWQGETVRHCIEDAIKARLKALSPEQLSELGLKLGKPKKIRKIVNVKAAFDKLLDFHKVPTEKLFMALGFSNELLADVMQREMGMNKAGAQEFIRETLADFIETNDSKAPLEKA